MGTEFYNAVMLKSSAGILGIRKAFDALKSRGAYFRHGVTMPDPLGRKFKGTMGIGFNRDALKLAGPNARKAMRDIKLPHVPGVYMKGDQAAAIGEATELPLAKLKGRSREMFNRIIGMHEDWEHRHPLKTGLDMVRSRIGSHIDPDVLLRESNVLATLPKAYNPVRKAFTDMRNFEQTKAFMESAVPGFTYGATRLSRHGRKRVGGIIRKSVEKTVRDALGANYDDVMQQAIS